MFRYCDETRKDTSDVIDETRHTRWEIQLTVEINNIVAGWQLSCGNSYNSFHSEEFLRIKFEFYMYTDIAFVHGLV
jgi:hypothetical protein